MSTSEVLGETRYSGKRDPSFRCPHCEELQCPVIPTCEHGVVWDPCSCCQLCASGPGETCNQAVDLCAPGLSCVTYNKARMRSDFQSFRKAFLSNVDLGVTFPTCTLSDHTTENTPKNSSTGQRNRNPRKKREHWRAISGQDSQKETLQNTNASKDDLDVDNFNTVSPRKVYGNYVTEEMTERKKRSLHFDNKSRIPSNRGLGIPKETLKKRLVTKNDSEQLEDSSLEDNKVPPDKDQKVQQIYRDDKSVKELKPPKIKLSSTGGYPAGNRDNTTEKLNDQHNTSERQMLNHIKTDTGSIKHIITEGNTKIRENSKFNGDVKVLDGTIGKQRYENLNAGKGISLRNMDNDEDYGEFFDVGIGQRIYENLKTGRVISPKSMDSDEDYGKVLDGTIAQRIHETIDAGEEISFRLMDNDEDYGEVLDGTHTKRSINPLDIKHDVDDQVRSEEKRKLEIPNGWEEDYPKSDTLGHRDLNLDYGEIWKYAGRSQRGISESMLNLIDTKKLRGYKKDEFHKRINVKHSFGSPESMGRRSSVGRVKYNGLYNEGKHIDTDSQIYDIQNNLLFQLNSSKQDGFHNNNFGSSLTGISGRNENVSPKDHNRILKRSIHQINGSDTTKPVRIRMGNSSLIDVWDNSRVIESKRKSKKVNSSLLRGDSYQTNEKNMLTRANNESIKGTRLDIADYTDGYEHAHKNITEKEGVHGSLLKKDLSSLMKLMVQIITDEENEGLDTMTGHTNSKKKREDTLPDDSHSLFLGHQVGSFHLLDSWVALGSVREGRGEELVGPRGIADGLEAIMGLEGGERGVAQRVTLQRMTIRMTGRSFMPPVEHLNGVGSCASYRFKGSLWCVIGSKPRFCDEDAAGVIDPLPSEVEQWGKESDSYYDA
uniref:IGFBP N-terminal domain-containing protein n=1 Tax=Timema shepardi TaxID=629360 RepID=A0A7R9G2R4_TIMSH|nr:unnamed protein product [Timema shepardi]